jgi:hypothetical protein
MVEKKDVKEKKENSRRIGIDVSPPEAKCDDERCVWHGKLPVRGRVFEGVVRSSKAPPWESVRGSGQVFQGPNDYCC